MFKTSPKTHSGRLFFHLVSVENCMRKLRMMIDFEQTGTSNVR